MDLRQWERDRSADNWTIYVAFFNDDDPVSQEDRERVFDFIADYIAEDPVIEGNAAVGAHPDAGYEAIMALRRINDLCETTALSGGHGEGVAVVTVRSIYDAINAPSEFAGVEATERDKTCPHGRHFDGFWCEDCTEDGA